MRADYCWRHVNAVQAWLAAQRGEPAPFALPGARARYPKDRPMVPRHVHLDVKVDLAGHRLDGHATLVLYCAADAVETIELDAYELDVTAVYLEGFEKPVAFQHDGHTLRIPLPQPALRTETRTVVVRYSVTAPRLGLYFIGPNEAHPDRPLHAWTQNQDDDAAYWFPCVDEPGIKATLSTSITAPDGLVALSNGVKSEANRAAHEKGWTTTSWTLSVPVPAYLVTLVVGPFIEHQEPGTTPDVVWYCLPGREADAARAFKQTRAMIDFFEAFTGVPYAFPRYGQVAVSEFVFGGMENTTLTSMTDTLLHDERAALDFSPDSLVAHELAHQWFGDLVTCREWAHAWLNEGFATYFDCLFLQHDKGQEEFDYELFDLARDYFDEDRSRYRRPIVAREYHEPVDLFDRHLYHKGAWVLHMLRSALGTESFKTGVRMWLRRFAHSQAETHDFRRAFEDATGTNLGRFFDTWIEKTGYPTLVYTLQSPPKSPPIVRIEVKSGPPGAIYETVVLARSGDKEVRIPVRIEDSPTSVVLSGLTAVPELVVVDPDYTLLGEVTPDLHGGQLEALVKSTRVSAARRIDGARALARRPGARPVDLLVTALTSDAFWGVRREIARVLGDLRLPTTRNALLAALATEKHPKVRRGIVLALGEFRDDANVAAALEPLARNGEPSYFVEADAFTALARTAGEAALPVLDLGLARESWCDVVRNGALSGLGWLRSEEAVKRLVAHIGPKFPTLVRAAAINALGRVGRDAPPHRKAVLEALATIGSDSEFRVQIALIAAAETIAVKESHNLVDRVERMGNDGRVRRRAGEARRAIDKKLDEQTVLGGLRDDVTRIRGDVSALRDRLDRVQAGGAS